MAGLQAKAGTDGRLTCCCGSGWVNEQKTLKKKLAKGVWDMTKQKVDVQVRGHHHHDQIDDEAHPHAQHALANQRRHLVRR